ncbi:MAG: response regulator [Deltaproteobacteria bacterium]|nr:MAG: response regulator [Deltaproteobacteria bacterium]
MKFPESLTILLVEDDPLIQDMITDCLSLHGCHLEVAADGREGIERFRTNRFDLVITDWAMPSMDGEEFARTIKAWAPNQPVLMLSGYGATRFGGTGPTPQVDKILKKPVQLDELLAVIADLIQRKRSGHNA